MGRILDSLKQPAPDPRTPSNPGLNGNGHGPHLVVPPTPMIPEDAGEEGEPGDAVPFIEVGPHRSMEGSPDVLASKTVFIGPRLQVPAPAGEPVPGGTLAPEPASTGACSPALHVWGSEDGSARDLDSCPQSAIPLPRPHGPRLAAELVAYHQPDHVLARQYCRLMERLAAGVSGRPAVLLFSAARPGCGATTTLLNLAISAARYARKAVVAVDGNLRRPALAERLGLSEIPGLRDVVNGTVPLDRALRETDQANLFALTAGASQPDQGLRYLAETVRSLLRQLRQRYDLVMVDGPRWDGQPDVVALGTACDAVYLVVREEEVESAQVDDLFQSIPEQGIRLAGCILA